MRSPSPQSAKTVLVVDDGDEYRIIVKWFLTNFGYEVDCARSAEEALARFHPKIHDAVVTDNRMPGMSGSEMAHVIKMRSVATPVIMYTGNTPQDQSCVDMVIAKPTHLLAVKEALDKFLSPAQDSTQDSKCNAQ